MCDLYDVSYLFIFQNLKCVFQDLVTENADLQSRVQSKDRELARIVSQVYIIHQVLFHVSDLTAGGTAAIQ